MNKPVLYHNPNCSKSRGVLAILQERKVEFDVVEYLKQPLSAEVLREVLTLIDDAPTDLVRKDAHFRELGLDAAAYETPEAVIGVLVEHPRLMQRPIFRTASMAVIGRPSERVEELL